MVWSTDLPPFLAAEDCLSVAETHILSVPEADIAVSEEDIALSEEERAGESDPGGTGFDSGLDRNFFLTFPGHV